MSWPGSGRDARALALGCHHLAELLRAGSPLVAALHAVAEDAPQRRLTRRWQRAASAVAAGEPLSAALAVPSGGFAPDLLARLRAAERDGALPAGLDDIECALLQALHHGRRLVTALAYPLVAGLALLAATLFLLVRIVPALAASVDPTRIAWHARPLLLASDWLLALTPASVSIVAAGVGGVFAIFMLAAGRPPHRVALTLAPAAGPVRREDGGRRPGAENRQGSRHGVRRRARRRVSLVATLDLANVAGTLRRLHAGGVPLDEALELAATGCRSRRLAMELRSVALGVSDGESLAAALADRATVPPLFVRFAAAGVSSGALDRALERAAATFESEALARLARREALAGPAVLCACGALLGWVVVSILLPVYERALEAGLS